jgi:hypothetical protein
MELRHATSKHHERLYRQLSLRDQMLVYPTSIRLDDIEMVSSRFWTAEPHAVPFRTLQGTKEDHTRMV